MPKEVNVDILTQLAVQELEPYVTGNHGWHRSTKPYNYIFIIGAAVAQLVEQ